VKVLFINDSTSSSNWGDRAAAVSLMAMVGQSGGQIVYAVTEQNLWDSSFGKPSQGLSPSHEGKAREMARLCLPPVVLDARRWVLSRRGGGGQDQHELIPTAWEDFEGAAARVRQEQEHGWPAVLSAMDDADVTVIHGASLHGNLLVPRTILFLTYLAKTRFGKPVMIVNHTADLENAVLRRMAEHVYPLFDDVVYRDPISAERLAPAYGGRFAADTAFWFKPAGKDAWAPLARRPTYLDVWPDTGSFDPDRPYLCLGGSSSFHDRASWDSLVDGYSAVIGHLRSTYSGTVVLTASAELDEPVFRVLARRFGLPLIGVRTPVQQAVDILGNADAYIGGRWHPSIFALRGGTPLLPLSSQTVKMKALANMTGSPETFDTLDLRREAPAIGRQLTHVLEQGDELRRRIAVWAAEKADNSWDNVAYLIENRAVAGSAEDTHT